MKVRIHRRDPAAILPRYQTAGSAGFDLASTVQMTLQPGEIRLVPTGLVIETPPGYFLAVVARSSTPIKKGLMVANGVGVVDSDYRGPDDEVMVEVINVTRGEVIVGRGDRLAQGLFLPVVQAEWEEIAEVMAPTRGGVGSTG
jgi:dUTP pyrophosphatase